MGMTDTRTDTRSAAFTDMRAITLLSGNGNRGFFDRDGVMNSCGVRLGLTRPTWDRLIERGDITLVDGRYAATAEKVRESLASRETDLKMYVPPGVDGVRRVKLKLDLGYDEDEVMDDL